MQLSRKTRLIAALIALVSLLFSQLAIAGYTCSSAQAAQVAEQAAMAMQMEHHHMEGCTANEEGKSALCHAHCQPDTQSLDRPASVDIPPFVAIAMATAIIDIPAIDTPVATSGDDISLRRITSPPLSIQHCCFRI